MDSILETMLEAAIALFASLTASSFSCLPSRHRMVKYLADGFSFSSNHFMSFDCGILSVFLIGFAVGYRGKDKLRISGYKRVY